MSPALAVEMSGVHLEHDAEAGLAAQHALVGFLRLAER
jgi:hypothetical protein